MDSETYRIIHLIGLAVLFLGLGGAFIAHRNDDPTGRRIAVAMHGIGLLAVIIAGFGMKAKVPVEGFPNWLIAKIGVWVLLGALPMLARAKILPGIAAWIAAIALGGVAIWLGLAKPF